MKKVMMAVTLVLVSLSPLIVSPMEKELTLRPEQVYQLSQHTATNLRQFQTIPQNPTTLADTLVYKDASLTQVKTHVQAGNKLNISKWLVNPLGEPIFRLQDGGYVLASQQTIFDDSVYSQRQVSTKFWTKDGLTVYKAPYTKGTETVNSQLKGYQSVQASQVARTHSGVYYLLEGQGWIRESDLSPQDNRIEAVQNLLNQKYNDPEHISVYVKQLETGQEAGINEEKRMYAASVAKLGILYYSQEQLLQNKAALTEEFQYTGAVNDYTGAYDPDGSGKISKKADDKNYSLETLLKAVAQNSDNVATNILGYYIANQYDENFQKTVDKASGASWNMENRELTSKEAGTLMEAIYEQEGDIITYLSSTDYDGERISKNISVPVAHKIGDAYDFKHDVAIIYADSPFILSIFTDKEGYDKITAIADDIYGILK